MLHLGSSAWRRRHSGANCESIHLLGNDCFEIEVAGTARFQQDLQKLAPQGLPRGGFIPITASLTIDRLLAGKSHLIDIAIGQQTIGYCPSYLATRYYEWLGDWGLKHALVECDARVMKKQCRDDTIAVLLDIDPQFRMTAGKVQPEILATA